MTSGTLSAVEVLVERRPTWARVDSGFYVASRDGEFVGSVDRSPDGSYLAFDSRSTPVGRYDTLEAAQRAAESIKSPDERRRARRVTRTLQRVAAGSGLVAGGMALTAGALAPYL